MITVLFAFILAFIPANHAPADITYPQPTISNAIPGDDNGDGIIDEDESGWSCATMGNKVCG